MPESHHPEQASDADRAIQNLFKVIRLDKSAWQPQTMWAEQPNGSYTHLQSSFGGFDDRGLRANVWGYCSAPITPESELVVDTPLWLDYCDLVEVYTERRDDRVRNSPLTDLRGFSARRSTPDGTWHIDPKPRTSLPATPQEMAAFINHFSRTV